MLRRPWHGTIEDILSIKIGKRGRHATLASACNIPIALLTHIHLTPPSTPPPPFPTFLHRTPPVCFDTLLEFACITGTQAEIRIRLSFIMFMLLVRNAFRNSPRSPLLLSLILPQVVYARYPYE